MSEGQPRFSLQRSARGSSSSPSTRCDRSRANRLRRTRAEKNDAGADENDGGPDDVPTIRSGAFEDPQPADRGRDVYAAIGSIGTPGIVGVDQGQEPGEGDQADHAGQDPDRRLAAAQPEPEGKAAADLRKRRRR